MDLQISVFLLFILFTAGHSLSCYNCMSDTGSCADQTVISCPSGSSQCTSSTTVPPVGDITSTVKVKGCAPACQNGSLNFGYIKLASSCCDFDQCNIQDAPDPSNVPNGKTCYSCDGQNCTNILSCSGTEDRCVEVTAASGGQSVVKGCASKSICVAPTLISDIGNVSCCEGNLCNGAPSVSQSSTVTSAPSVSQSSTVTSAPSVSQSSTVTSAPSVSQSSTVTSAPSVYQSSTFNGAPSVSQSFLFLCCSLLSYFLLH